MNPNPFTQMVATLAATPRKRPVVNRLIKNADMTESETWDVAVARLLGPVVKTTDREQRRTDALALLEAAQRAVNANCASTPKQVS